MATICYNHSATKRKEEKVTVCIAAICKSGDAIVAVADRMMTAPDIEFEQDTGKIETLSSNCVALTAGSALAHTELFGATKAEIQDLTLPPISQITAVVKKNFATLRRRRAEETCFNPLGLTIQGFFEQQRHLNPDLVMKLANDLDQAAFPLRVLIAGIDTTGCHIYQIVDPGTSECFDALGFCAIGSGERHADTTFIFNNFSVNMVLSRAVCVAYEAKRRAEVAPGVGTRFTDVAIITKASGFTILDDAKLDKLAALYEEKRAGEEQVRTAIEPKLATLLNEEAPHG